MTDTYELWCLVKGDTVPFPVLASPNTSIGLLKELIHGKRKDGPLQVVGPADLTLAKVNVDFNTHKDEIRSGKYNPITYDRPDEWSSVAEVWPVRPPNHHLHIFVIPPQAVKVAELPSLLNTHLASVAEARDAPAPSSVANNVFKFASEQNKCPIYNGRPRERRGPPVTIYDPSLATLKQVLSDLSIAPEPDLDCLRTTAMLFLAATHIYENENERGKAIYPHVEHLLGANLDLLVKVLEEKSNKKAAEGDAVLQETLMDGVNKAAVVYIELKNELGLGGVGGLQAALSLRKHLAQTAYTKIRDASCCPCVVISLAGPHLQIFGAVFVDVFVVQHFTQILSLDDAYDTGQINYVAKAFTAVERAVRTLRQQYYYLDLEQRSARLPCPTYLPNSPLPGSLIFKGQFNFEGRDPSNHSRTLFLAEYCDKTVLVKFCETYGEAAHKLLAAEGLAPTLHFCSKIIGKGFMVIMDLVDGRDAYHLFKHDDLPSAVVDDLKCAVKKLHDADLVFGDVRRPNVMVLKSRDEEERHGVLVDFDWAGSVGNARYPANLNASGEIKWADGVAPMGEIKKQHDLDMLESVIRGRDQRLFRC